MIIKFILEFIIKATFWLFTLISSFMPSFDFNFNDLLSHIISISSQAR